ncbi:hypothetical protein [Chitinophaga sp. LS1]|uniref:hypothetical protein n=1 Tax=Chitinophaga sp. LS1 TaxID=3051176 RepID=UPI002AAB5954|nr:hypothetical protein [Chitinophaga sp. LS1]WPV67085.1 hypothetical protein QQL36_35430 [Chitinophaga sp. LS1]
MFKVTCLLVVLLVACNHSPVERDRTEKKEVSLDSLSFGSLLTNEADSKSFSYCGHIAVILIILVPTAPRLTKT